jgi:hypothetical protein
MYAYNVISSITACLCLPDLAHHFKTEPTVTVWYPKTPCIRANWCCVNWLDEEGINHFELWNACISKHIVTRYNTRVVQLSGMHLRVQWVINLNYNNTFVVDSSSEGLIKILFHFCDTKTLLCTWIWTISWILAQSRKKLRASQKNYALAPRHKYILYVFSHTKQLKKIFFEHIRVMSVGTN